MQSLNLSFSFVPLCCVFFAFPALPVSAQSPTLQSPRILTNQVGYEDHKAKRAVVIAGDRLPFSSFQLIDEGSGKPVYTGKPVYSGPVSKWKHWQFWTLDFSSYTTHGAYCLQVEGPDHNIISQPFLIGKNILEAATLSDILYYFKGQRSAGLLDQADHHLLLPSSARMPSTASSVAASSRSIPSASQAANAPPLPSSSLPTTPQTAAPDTLDLHGGWYDATGDYGKHLSHLSFSSYFNPQQIPFVVYSLLKTDELLAARTGTDFRQMRRRLMDEAIYGADYLVRVHVSGGSFYRSIAAPGPGKLARDRVLSPEQQSYSIKQSKDQSIGGDRTIDNWRSYQSGYRSGGGVAIAALALASKTGVPGEKSNAAYLRAAEEAFAFLEKESPAMTNDGKENIVDDYCALAAATELYAATHNEIYHNAAEKRTQKLIGRLTQWKTYTGYWRADDGDRPFFHPSDAGLPVVSLLYYYSYASAKTQPLIKEAVRRSLQHELAITHEVNNPFGYSRQLVQDTLGHRHGAFFFPHGSEAAPWWQGEDARLSSMAAAARLAIPLFADTARIRATTSFTDSLESFALDQLNWILGLNPYDASLLQGTGRNNPAYGFFGTFEYTNAPGGIVNGITSGLDDEEDIDFNLSYAMTGKDYDWRWAEQWLPHDAWYLLAIAAGRSPEPPNIRNQ